VNIVLAGMRGAGKTCAGRLLAGRLRLPFVDTDEEIERRTGEGIDDIFRLRGEEWFRAVEERVCAEALAGEGRVVSLGGGAVESGRTAALAAAQLLPVWLDAAPRVLAGRLRGSGRPALTGLGVEEEVELLRRRRAPLYERATRIRLDTGVLTPEEVCDAVEQLWRAVSGDHVR